MEERITVFFPGIDEARRIISQGEYTLVLIKDGEIVHRGEGRGVSPILRALDSGEGTLCGACAADKIVGKAAAMLLYLGGARAVFGETMSDAADSFLTSVGIPHSWGKKVAAIRNRAGTGLCPIEQSVILISDAAEGERAIRERIAELRRGM